MTIISIIVVLPVLLSSCGSSSTESDLAGNRVTPDPGEAIGACNNDWSCESDAVCDPQTFTCRLPECNSDNDCLKSYGSHRICDNYLCLMTTCASHEDCTAESYCTAGYCREYPDCDHITDLKISPVLPYLKSSQALSLNAAVYDDAGTIIPGRTITWTSLNSDVVAVGEKTGVAIGGVTEGTTTIYAEIIFDDAACEGKSIRETITLTNFTNVVEGVRVIVVNEVTGDPVGGATVLYGDQAATTSEEVEAGVVRFKDVEPPADIHVFHTDFDYLSAINVYGNDLLIPLRPSAAPDRTPGAKVELDYSRFHPDQRTDTGFGMAGQVFTDSLLDFGPHALLGEVIPANSLPLDQDLEDTSYRLPANFTVSAIDSSNDLSVYISGNRASSVLWGWGGYLDLESFRVWNEAALTNGWSASSAAFISSLLTPDQTQHGYLSGIAMTTLPRVKDDGEQQEFPFNEPDIDRDGSIDDVVPFYSSFETIDSPLYLSQKMSRKASVKVSDLPWFASGQMDGAVVIVGARLNDESFLPLGMAAGLAEDIEEAFTNSLEEGLQAVYPTPKSINEPLQVPFASQYGGMHGDYLVLAVATQLSKFIENPESMGSFSTVVSRHDKEPNTVDVNSFLPLVAVAYAKPDEREVVLYAVQGADMHRVVFGTESGRRWEVYLGSGYDDFEEIRFNLPTPTGDDPFSIRFHALAVDLDDETEFGELLEFNAKPLHRAGRYTERYSQFRVTDEQENQ